MAGLLAGCSLLVDLEGPPAYQAPPAVDRGPAPDARTDAVRPVALDAAVDAAPDAGPPPATVVTTPGARVIRHRGGDEADAPVPVPADGRLRVEVAPGDALTVVLDEVTDGLEQVWLVTLADVQPGETLPVSHPAPAGERMTSMLLRLGSRRDGAAGYVASNGCVEQRCEAATCDPWFMGRDRSIAVTERCIDAQGRVRTLAIAHRDDGRPVAWAGADDPVPADDAQARPSFGPWEDRWQTVKLSVESSAARVLTFARPFEVAAFGVGVASPLRPADGEPVTLRVPAGFAPYTEVGIDLDDAARDRPARGWRSYFGALPEELTIDLDATVPAVPDALLIVDEAGSRPAVRWSARSPAEGDAARVELAWRADGRIVTWIFFGSARLGEAQVPALPDELADLGLEPGATGTYAQVTILRCDGVQSPAEHRTQPCPVYGAYRASEPGRTVSWSSALAEPPPPPDAGPPDAGASDAGG